jgi:putative spermidine/putrescine transport system ATP-binding protein
VIERNGRRCTVRPEKIRLLDDDREPPSAEGVVREVAYLGAITRYQVELDSGETLVVVRQNLSTSAEQALAQHGRRVRLAWRREDLSALDTSRREEQ